MKVEYLTMVIAVLAATTARTHSSPPENRYATAGNRAERATDFRRDKTARKIAPFSNGESSSDDSWRNANSPWDGGEHSEYQTFTKFSLWKAPVYEIRRPYFVPIYGSSGRIPIYFAPQSFDQFGNNKPPFMGTPYLPPKEYPPKEYLAPTTEQPLETTMTVKNRFEFDDDDDRPIWGKGTDNDISVEGYKPPRPPVSGGAIHLSAQDEENLKAIFKMDSAPTTRRPAARPRTTTTAPQTPASAPASASAPAPTNGPSNCVWAVVSCCSANTNAYPEKCFEQKGCPGPFWGTSPCDTNFAKVALEAALKYYEPQNK